ncbi:hypothetical protein [Simplicispira metamorpha]|nr:hypothetical protein [Simplicispira metamorpha]
MAELSQRTPRATVLDFAFDNTASESPKAACCNVLAKAAGSTVPLNVAA